MTIQELEELEAEEQVRFLFNPMTKRINVSGIAAGIERSLKRIENCRDEVGALLRQRQGLPEPGKEIIEREIPLNVPSLSIQKESYRRWYMTKSLYFRPSEIEEDRMFAACSEGDEIIFDFAHSFTVRKPNGLLVSVDRRGRIGEPSPYSPAVREQKRA